ncbi:MAG: carboxypeptidase-like regulatory domain-containing protein [Acidobacteriota bacterium]|nr:carboxypeptidase-like regulatory domain-containing protein [Acidobacteriota bacterium]
MQRKRLYVAVIIVAVGLLLFLFRDASWNATGEETATPQTAEDTHDQTRRDTSGPNDEATADADRVNASTTDGDTKKHRKAKADGVGLGCFGTVLHEGKAFAGARVVLRGLDGDGYKPPVMSGPDGAFRFEKLEAGAYFIHAVAPGLISFDRAGNRLRFQVGEEEPSVGPLNLEMKPAHELVLTVVARETGEPVAGAAVTPVDLAGETYKTDENGRVNLFLSPEIWSLEVAAPGFARARRVFDNAGQERSRFTVFLEPGGMIEGVVYDESRQPFPGARVTLEGRRDHVFSDAAGAFRIESLPFGERLFFGASAPGYKRASKMVQLSVDRKTMPVELVLKPPTYETTITGRVTDERDLPVEGAAVVISDREPVQTRGDGSFEVQLPKGSFKKRLQVTKPGYAVWAQIILRVDWDKPLHIRLSPGFSLEGRVVDSLGAPLSGVKIQAENPVKTDKFSPLRRGSRRDVMVTDSAGSFQLRDLPRDVDLSFSRAGYLTKKLPGLVLTDMETLEVVLSEGLAIAGRVIDARTGRPVPSFTVKVFSQSGYRMRRDLWDYEGVQFDAPDGRFLLDKQKNEKRFLIIAAGEGVAGYFSNIVPLEEPVEREFLIGADAVTVSGTVQTSRGEPVAGAEVLLWCYQQGHPFFSFFSTATWSRKTFRQQALLFREATTDATGRFLFENLPEGNPADLMVIGDTIAPVHLAGLMDKPVEERENLEIRVVRNARLTVTVNKETYPDGFVRLFLDRMGGTQGHSLKKGHKADFEKLQPGNYQVSLKVSGQTTESESVTLDEGESLELKWGFDRRFTVGGSAFHGNLPASGHQLFLIPNTREPWVRRAEKIKYAVEPDGSFRFKNVKPGAYTLVLGGKGEPFFERVLHLHPNRFDFQVAAEDIRETVAFHRFGALTGRLKNASFEWVTLVGAIDGLTYRRSKKPAGKEFRFDSVPPGVYDLVGGDGFERGELLVSGLTMPANGPDMDVGEVGTNTFGSLLVRFTPEPISGWMDLALTEAGGEQPAVRRKFSVNGSTVLSAEIPTGVWRVDLVMSFCGREAVIEQPDIQVREGETSEVSVQLEPATELVFLLNVAGRRMTSARLERKEQTIQCIFVEEEDFIQGRGAFFSDQGGSAFGVPEGMWTLKVSDDRGETYTRRLHLKAGVPVMEKLSRQ